jgi:hypothetical protein
VNCGIRWTSSAASYRQAVSYVGLQPVDDRFSAERCSGNYISYGIKYTDCGFYYSVGIL